MDVDRVMLTIGFNVHTEIEGDTPEIMHPEPLLHLILDLPYQALVSNDMELVDKQHDRSKYILILIMEHDLSSVDMCCHEPNRDYEVFESAIPNVRRPFQAIKRLPPAKYHLPRSLCISPCLERMKISPRRLHIDRFLHVTSQESRAYVQLMDLQIVHAAIVSASLMWPKGAVGAYIAW